ncbi:DUF7426 family protein [Timonella sp. A28]|uniref:DUF7426 family protein n=1 Tax=Timonella sp. A28 TaxID=3442640 RepID=UPI003EBA4E44
MLKDLSAFLTPNLELTWRDRTFIVPPPSREDGLTMTAINTAGALAYAVAQGACPTCHRSDHIELDDRQKELVALAKNRVLAELSLGGAYTEMLEAGVPGPDIELFELYAFYYWVLGESAADEWIAAVHQGKAGVTAPKVRPRPKNGRSTGSGRPSAKTKTGSRSTQITDSQKS